MMVASRPKPRTTSGKKIHASGFGQPSSVGDPPHGDAQDHGADVLGGRRLEEVGATTGAIADVVADKVRHDRRVARVILGDACLDLADKVGTDVGRLGVDPAAELGEERHEAGAEAEADDQERSLLGMREAAEGGEDAEHPEEGEGHDQEARDGAAAHRDLHRSHQAVLRGRGGPQVGLDADVHADDAGGHRARSADQEGNAGADAELETEDVGVGNLATLHEGDDGADDDRSAEGEQADGPILATDEGDRALIDRAGDVTHRVGAGIGSQDVPREVEGEGDRGKAGERDHPQDGLELHGSSECGRRPRNSEGDCDRG